MRAVSSTYANNRRLDTHLCSTPSDMKSGAFNAVSLSSSSFYTASRGRNPFSFTLTFSHLRMTNQQQRVYIYLYRGRCSTSVVYGPLCNDLVPQFCSKRSNIHNKRYETYDMYTFFSDTVPAIAKNACDIMFYFARFSLSLVT